MPATIEPEPSETEREVLLAALTAPRDEESAWAEAALAEGVEDGEPGP